jgi:hypothetical protein
MTIDGDVLEIELDMDLNDVVALKQFIDPRLEYIESIEIIGSKDRFSSSSLFALLFSIKKTNPSIKIPFLDNGDFTLKHYGKMHWIKND